MRADGRIDRNLLEAVETFFDARFHKRASVFAGCRIFNISSGFGVLMIIKLSSRNVFSQTAPAVLGGALNEKKSLTFLRFTHRAADLLAPLAAAFDNELFRRLIL